MSDETTSEPALSDVESWPLAALCGESDSLRGGRLSGLKSILQSCLKTLERSPAAQVMIRDASKEGWRLGAAGLCGYDFQLDVCDKTILLDNGGLEFRALGRSEYFRNILSISLIRALRDAWQEGRHGGFDRLYGLDAVLMLERVRAADLDVMSALVAWELQAGGAPELWRHLIGSDCGDVALAFSGTLGRGAAKFSKGEAMSHAFTSWYQDERRINACDHETLNYVDLLMAEGSRPGRKDPTPVGVEILSCLPDKTAYLKGMGRAILTDPLYAGLGEPVNQSHYLQIIYDLSVTRVQGVPFRDAALAAKIFPDGRFTEETGHCRQSS